MHSYQWLVPGLWSLQPLQVLLLLQAYYVLRVELEVPLKVCGTC
jgi:hypothetical protein